MRKLWLLKEDYELFQQEINPHEFIFFRNHIGTFKRMWEDQGKQFWTKYVDTFKEYVRKHGCVKDLVKKHCDTITKEEMDLAVDEVFIYIFTEFVTGKVSMAKNLVMDCVVVAQNQHTLSQLDKQSCIQNPFYSKTTREVFRKLFGPPNERRTYMKLLCGYPVFVRFAGSIVIALRRWLEAEVIDVDSEYAVKAYFDLIHEGSPDSSKQIKMKTVAVGISRNREKGGVDLHITKDLHKPTEHSYDIHVPKKKKGNKTKSKHSLKNLQVLKGATSTVDSQQSIDHVDDHDDDDEYDDEEEEEEEESDTDSINGESQQDIVTKDEEEEDGDSLFDEQDDGELNNKTVVTGDGQVDDQPNGECDDGKLEDTYDDRPDYNDTTDNYDCKPNGKLDDKPNGKLDAKPYGTLDDKPFGTLDDKPYGTLDDKPYGKPDGDKSINKLDSIDKPDDDKLVNSHQGVDVTNEGQLATLEDKILPKLHSCANCKIVETEPKTFKRCHKCKGKSNPRYYCSRDCQALDWRSSHKIDHRED